MTDENTAVADSGQVPPPAQPAETSQEAMIADPTEEVEAAEGGEGEAASPEDKPKKGGFQKRIDELTRKRYELENQNQALQEQLQAYTGRLAQNEHNEARPTLEQYNYDEQAYSQAMQAWMTEGLQKQQQAAQMAQQQLEMQAQQLQRQQMLEQRMQQAVEKYPDFVEAINSPGLPQFSQVNPYAYEAIVNSEMMAMHLARSPDEAHKLAGMSPIDAVKQVARLEAMLSRPQPNPKPQPPATVAGRNDVGADPANMTPEEYRDWRMAQKRKR